MFEYRETTYQSLFACQKTRFLVKIAGFFSEMVFVANKRCAFLKSQKSLLIRVKDF